MKIKIIASLCVMTFAAGTGVSALAADNPAKTENVASMVKLDFNSVATRNLCTGTLVGKDLVLTASHCVIDSWAANPARTLIARFGSGFSHTLGLYKNGTDAAWIKFDPETDLALIRLSGNATAFADAVPSTLVQPCSTLPALSAPVTGIEYRRMSDNLNDLPQDKHNTSTITFIRTGNSALANGKSYISDNKSYGKPGDSGGGVFTPQGEQFGVYNGSSSTNSYVSAVCVYADRIRAEAAKLGSSIG